MAGNMSRNKGQRAEREVCKLLQPVVNQVYTAKGLEPPALERNLMQTRNGGYDIAGLEWLALEVKHHETLQITQWWCQTKQQSKVHQTPVLIYRQNRVKWRVMMFGALPAGDKQVRAPVDIALDAFLVWFKIKLEFQVQA